MDSKHAQLEGFHRGQLDWSRAMSRSICHRAIGIAIGREADREDNRRVMADTVVYGRVIGLQVKAIACIARCETKGIPFSQVGAGHPVTFWCSMLTRDAAALTVDCCTRALSVTAR